MAAPGQSPLRIMLAGVVLLLGGVLVVGIVGLRRAADQAVESARSESADSARALARELREGLSSPSFLASVPESWRFAMREGELVVPPEVGWINEAPAVPPLRLSAFTEKLRERARAAEFGEGEPAAAAAWWDEVLATASNDPRVRAALALQAAWSAHRGGKPERRDALIARSRFEDRFLPGVLPLLAAAKARPGAETLAALQPLDDAAAGAIFERIEEVLPSEATAARAAWSALADRDAAVRARRRMLQRVASPLRGLDPDGDPGSFVLDGGLLVHDATRGRGAWIPQEHLLPLLRARAGDAAPRLLPDPVEETAVPVVAGLAIVPATPSPGPSRLLLPALLLVLALAMGVGVVAVVRATWREAAAARERAEFLTNVTHELKTPLASIRLLADMLDQDRVEDPAQAREYYRLLAGEAARLGTMVESVLDLGRLERGERAYDLREHAVRELLGEAVEVFRPLASQSEMPLEVALPDPGWRCRVDRGAVVQAMLNVMENARKYAATGGPLEVTSRRTEHACEIAFRDHGPGIPEAERASVFDRFRRGQRHAAGEVPGLGLGLYLARTLMRDQGGDLRLEIREQDTGARFVFTLPLTPRDAAVPALAGGSSA